MNRYRFYRPCCWGLLLMALGNAAQGKTFECLIEPSQVLEIRTPIEGLIEKINVDRGDTIKQGQILVVLDTSVEKTRSEQARFKASVRGPESAAQSRLGFSSLKFGRNQSLFQDKYISANDKDESEAALKLAEAELLEARENKRTAELQFKEYEEIMRLKTLRSPIDGVVIERGHHPGEVAQLNDKLPLLKLAKIDPLFVELVLPASAFGKIRVGDEILIKPLIEGIKPFYAKVKLLDPVVDAASATLGARLEVPNPGGQLPAGISCQAEINGL